MLDFPQILIYLLSYCYPTILIFTVIVIVKNWKKSIRNNFQENSKSVWLIIFAALFTTIAPLIGFMRFDNYGSDSPFSTQHVLAIEILVVVSAMCYWLSKIWKKDFPPFMNLFLRAGLIQGIVLDIIVTIHFGQYMIMGIAFPFAGFELLAPPLAMTFLLYELQCNFRMPKQNTSPESSMEKNILLEVGTVVLLIVVEQALVLPLGLGLHWNSLVLAFTESRGFLLSSNFRF